MMKKYTVHFVKFCYAKEITSILKVLLNQYKSPTGPKKFARKDERRQKLNFICIVSIQIQILNLKSKSYETADKSPDQSILGKGNNLYKRGSNMTKVELDLYYFKINSQT